MIKRVLIVFIGLFLLLLIFEGFCSEDVKDLKNIPTKSPLQTSEDIEEIFYIENVYKIIKKRGKHSIEKSKIIAEHNFFISQKYGIDPYLLLAIQRQESAFKLGVISKMDCIGINQIKPSTARGICNQKGWEYKRQMLFDYRINIEMGGFLLRELQERYKIPNLILAHYNGGFLQASYYKSKSPELASETRKYIKRVNKFYKKYKNLNKVTPPIIQTQYVNRDI